MLQRFFTFVFLSFSQKKLCELCALCGEKWAGIVSVD